MSVGKTLVINSAELNIKVGNILKSLDVPEENADDFTLGLIEELSRECLRLVKPQSKYILLENPEFVSKTEMRVWDEIFNLDKIVLNALKKSSHIVFFVATAGDEIESLSKKLIAEKQTLEGLIVDLTGSEIAENIAEITHRKIEADMLNLGFNATNRYSPGYCNWPVSDQKKLFKLVLPDIIGVSLSESSLMHPIKSVSGIIGVGINVKHREYTCKKCDAGFCIYRDKD